MVHLKRVTVSRASQDGVTVIATLIAALTSFVTWIKNLG
jgi:hypothetical protein